MNAAQVTLLLPRLIVGAAGLLLLLAGARLWRIAVIAPGIAAGAMCAAWVGAELALPPAGIAGCSAVGALIGALVAAVLERVAMVAAGVLGGVGAVELLSRFVAVPMWAWLFGALLGAACFPVVWRGALVPITAWVGAVCIVDAAGYDAPWSVLLLAVIGALVQVSTASRARE